MAEDQSTAKLAALLCVNQRERWQQGQRVPAEAYFERYPALKANGEWAADLVYNEIVLREERGEQPQLEEYLWRFPNYQPYLKGTFEVHRAFVLGTLRDTPVTVLLRRTPAVTPPQGESINRPTLPGYEILAEIGRGGMGVVYQARHLQLNRIVALKMILAGAHAGAEQLARFRAGAEASARLQHPNIVQIYDIGEQNGQPFVALEYVAGTGLDKHLAGTPQSPEVAAALVETLARAMHFAHEHGVIHRDLKPANILLQRGGTRDEGLGIRDQGIDKPKVAVLSRPIPNPQSLIPKITDFGLAKQLDVESGLTATDAIVGTPSYMAPEQAVGANQTVGPAADIYALGVILYETLTGRPPFKAATLLGTLEQVRTQEPVSPARLQPLVPHDLETICMKCLQKEPGKRYATAHALADDLKRYRSGQPIVARPIGGLERAWRWCRRNPLVAGLWAALVFVILCGFTAVLIEWRRAETHLEDELYQRGVAQTNEQRALTQSKLREANEKKALEQTKLAEKHLKEALYQQSLAVASEGDALKQSRLYEASFQQARTVVDYLSDLSRLKLAKKPGVQAIRKELLEVASKYYQRFVEERKQDVSLRADLVKTYFQLALINSDLGHKKEALVHYQQCVDLQEKLVQEKATDTSLQSELAGTYNNIANVLQDLSELSPALAWHKKALRMRERLAQAHPDHLEFNNLLAQSHNNLGVLQRALANDRDFEALVTESLRSHEKALDVLEKPELAKHRDQLKGHRAGTYLNIGNRWYVLKQLAKAVDYQQKSVALWEELRSQSKSSEPELLKATAQAYDMLGIAQKNHGQHQEAFASYQKAIQILGQLNRSDPEEIIYVSELSRTCLNLGMLCEEIGKKTEALASYQQALAHQKRVIEQFQQEPRQRDRLQQRYLRVGRLLNELGRPMEAATVALESRQYWAADPGELFHIARHLALSVSLMDMVKLEPAVRDAERKKYTQEVFVTLRMAIRHGFKDADRLEREQAFAALRTNPDFHDLITELRKKGKN